MRVMMIPSTQEKCLALNETWVRQCVTKDLGTVHDCYVEKVKENGDIEILG